MEDLFARVKKEVSIVGYVESVTGSAAKKEGSTLRINPCPFCGHRDCFTIYPNSESFVCFSCQAGGDVIGFERLLRGLESNLEAANSLAERRGISLERDSKGEPLQAIPGKAQGAKVGLVMASEKARELRRMATNFYHDELLRNEKALNYQTKERRHSLQTLEQFKVGFSSRSSIIAHSKKLGYSVEDLVGVGLARKVDKGFRAVIPFGFYVYPHIVDGKVLYLSIKDPKGKYKFQVKKDYVDQEWLCYGQEAFGKSGCIIVEGENDLLSVVGKAGRLDVACTNGNYNTTNIVNFLAKNSKGQRYFLCFDRDQKGDEYAQKYGSAILGGEGEARVIKVPEPHKDVDEFLLSSKDPKEDFDKLVAEAAVFEKSQPIEKVSAGPRESNPYKFDNFRVDGEGEGGEIVFWSKVNSKSYVVSLKDLNLDKLVQIGGSEVQGRVVNRNAEDGQILFRTLKKFLIIEASKCQLGRIEWFGQGIHFLGDGQLLIVNGAQAYFFDGKRFNELEAPLIDRRLIARDAGRAWVDMGAVQKSFEGMTKRRAGEIIETFRDLIGQWGFLGIWDVSLVLGFFLSQVVQQVWVWRPHLWITAAQGSGKTLLIEFFETIAGDLALRREGQVLTEAGFRQDIGQDSRLCYLDEFERSQARAAIIEYLRSAGRGGIVTKGGVNQRPVHFHIRHQVVVSSIEVGLGRAAELSRFIVVELKKDPSRRPKIPNSIEAEKLRVDLLAVALWAAFPAKKLVEELGQIEGFEDRLVECFAVPLSMLACAIDDPLGELRKLVLIVLEDLRSRERDVGEEDEDCLLQDIGSATIRVPDVKVSNDGGADTNVYLDMSVCQLLESFSDFNSQILQAHGIKYDKGNIFLAPSVIERKLLRDTKWKGLNILSILKRIEGAEKSRRRIASQNVRGVLLRDRQSLVKD